MVILGGIIAKHFNFSNFKLYSKFIRTCSIYNKQFECFRKKDDYKKSVVPLYTEESELARLATGPYKEQNIKIDGIFYHLMQRENVMKLTTPQIKDILCLMANVKIDTQKYAPVLKYIDEKCAVSVERWSLDLSLFILDAWFIILGPKACKKYYYSAITNLWNRKMQRCSKQNLILVMHFIGMGKHTPPFLMEMLEDKLEHFIDNLTDQEWAIACMSFFKTSTRVQSQLLLNQLNKVAGNLLQKNDRFNLICILKCLRLSRYFDVNLFHMLTEYIKKEYSSFNFIECTNFLACFTTQNVYNSDVYKCLENHGIFLLSQEDDPVEFNKDIQKMHPSERSRVKDIARFLWGMAFVGHNLEEKSLNFVIPLLNAKIISGEFETNLPALVDCVQSLVLLGCYPKNILEYVITPSFLHKISEIYKAKPKYQIYFVYRSVYLENFFNEIQFVKYSNHIPKNLQKDIEERNGFQDLINYLSNNTKENSFVSCYIMPHIMISGIFVASKSRNMTSDNLVTDTLIKFIQDGIISKSIQDILCADKVYTCIEILDSSVCAYNSHMPLGLLKTKLRQLRKLNIDIITMTPEEISMLKTGVQGSCSKLANIIA